MATGNDLSALSIPQPVISGEKLVTYTPGLTPGEV